MKLRNGSTIHRGGLMAGLYLAALLLGERPAHATILEACVTNNTELANVLANAQTVPVKIKLRQGTYDLANTVFTSNNYPPNPIAGGTSLLGGYTGQTCDGRDIALGNTVMTYSGPNTVYAATNPLGSLTVEGLTWHTFLAVTAIGHSLPSGAQWLFRRNAFTGLQAGLQLETNSNNGVDTSVRIVDTIVAGSNVFCPLTVASNSGTVAVTLINDTVINNTSLGFCGYPHNGNDPSDGYMSVAAYNDIFFGNTANVDPSDFYMYSGNDVVLFDNIIGTRQGPAPQVEVGTLHVDPQLASDFRPIQAPPSPAINSGTDQVSGGLPSTDIDGRDRIVGSAPDRGAYESTVDDSNTLVVNTTNDSGVGSLRAAIVSANANPGFNLIKFSISGGCGPQLITLNSELPGITSSTRINGYSQPGSSKNDLEVGSDATICIILGGAAHNINNGLLVDTTAPANTSLTVDGLAFSGFANAAINLRGGKDHAINGVHIGGGVGGVSLNPSAYGVNVAAGVSGVTIGSDDLADRNLIGAATADGIRILANAHDNQIVNNYVGIGWSASTDDYVNRGNTLAGIHILGHDNSVSDNLIGYNGSDGVDLDGAGALSNSIRNNGIGVDDFASNLGNGSMGVRVENAAYFNTIQSNFIAMNAGSGVRVVSGQGNTIRKNGIFQNSLYAIDLAGVGVTANDDDGAVQVTDYANRGQNFPVLTLTTGSVNGGAASGTLTTLPGDYTVDLYSDPCDASGYGEGKTWLHSGTVSIANVVGGHQNTAHFSIPLPPFTGSLNGTLSITATATDAAGNTSEFSACSPYTKDAVFADGFD